MGKSLQYPLGLTTSGAVTSLLGLRLEFWSIWTIGNYAGDARKINHLVQRLDEWIGNMVERAPQAAENGNFHFVNVSVGDDDIEKIDELFPTADVTFGLLTAVLTEGLKVSFAVNGRNDLTICSLSDRREDSPSFGACLTGGGDGWYESLCVCLYKYTALLQGDLNNGSTSTGSRRRII